tara:strand:+ start:1462 stop:2502 length:1041 start_codon:yes stop_codon:yes gene_type:complete
MSPEELLKKAESLAKQLADAKKVLAAASDAGKKIAQAKVDKLEAGIKAMGKKASPAMQKLKKAGNEGAAIAGFWTNPIGSLLKKDGLKDIKSAVSSVYGAVKKGYDFSRGMDDKLYDAAKKYAPEIAAGVANMTGPVAGVVGGAAVRAGRKVEKASKDADAAETKKLIAEQRKQKGLKEVEKQTKDAAKKKTVGSYAEAKKKDPKLDSYIAMRKKTKKGTEDYKKIQRKINAAYGIGKADAAPKKLASFVPAQAPPKKELAVAKKESTQSKAVRTGDTKSDPDLKSEFDKSTSSTKKTEKAPARVSTKKQPSAKIQQRNEAQRKKREERAKTSLSQRLRDRAKAKK